MSHKAMGASSPMCDLLVVRCSNIFCALHHSWRARCRNIFAQRGGGGGGHDGVTGMGDGVVNRGTGRGGEGRGVVLRMANGDVLLSQLRTPPPPVYGRPPPFLLPVQQGVP